MRPDNRKIGTLRLKDCPNRQARPNTHLVKRLCAYCQEVHYCWDKDKTRKKMDIEKAIQWSNWGR